jgi:hypothetical protein
VSSTFNLHRPHTGDMVSMANQARWSLGGVNRHADRCVRHQILLGPTLGSTYGPLSWRVDDIAKELRHEDIREGRRERLCP